MKSMKRPHSQNFIKVIHCTLPDLERITNEVMEELYKDNFKIMNTKYSIHDGYCDVIIQYVTSYTITSYEGV